MKFILVYESTRAIIIHDEHQLIMNMDVDIRL